MNAKRTLKKIQASELALNKALNAAIEAKDMADKHRKGDIQELIAVIHEACRITVLIQLEIESEDP